LRPASTGGCGVAGVGQVAVLTPSAVAGELGDVLLDTGDGADVGLLDVEVQRARDRVVAAGNAVEGRGDAVDHGALDLVGVLIQYAEVYVTNRFGVVVAATNRTSDYLQADDGWYRQAMAAAGPIWLGDLEYDASSESHGIDIVIRLYDAEGRYQGILKAKRDQAAAGVRQLGTRVRRDGVTEGMGSGMGSDLAIRVRDGVRSCNQGQGWGPSGS
jgi:hypothetical protein